MNDTRLLSSVFKMSYALAFGVWRYISTDAGKVVNTNLQKKGRPRRGYTSENGQKPAIPGAIV